MEAVEDVTDAGFLAGGSGKTGLTSAVLRFKSTAPAAGTSGVGFAVSASALFSVPGSTGASGPGAPVDAGSGKRSDLSCLEDPAHCSLLLILFVSASSLSGSELFKRECRRACHAWSRHTAVAMQLNINQMAGWSEKPQM